MKKNIFYILLLFLLCCKSKETPADEEVKSEVQTPVTVASISQEPMEDYVELNAISSFLQKWDVKANITGYLQTSQVQLNQPVSKGEILYTVKTKEAESIGNTISILDSTLKFNGINKIPAVANGFISQINHQAGDFVQEGEPLATITDIRSFVFLLDMPYELRPYILTKKILEMVLPDGEKLNGIISGNMPGMDPASQTQRIILRVSAPHFLPENLIAKVKVIKSEKNNTVSLPKSALLTDETQSEFWVMKMTDSSTAVKVPVTKGIENGDKVEILSPKFSSSDKILITGNYGLPDTAKVKIVQQ